MRGRPEVAIRSIVQPIAWLRKHRLCALSTLGRLTCFMNRRIPERSIGSRLLISGSRLLRCRRHLSTPRGPLVSNELILVAGGGGFIGGHLVADLLSQGKRVRAVDAKPISEWHQVFDEVENLVYDLSDLGNCHRVTDGATEVYQLAADMGGMGFIENNKALCMLSVLPSTHMLMAARDAGVERLFYSSSACVYAASGQTSSDVTALKESDAYPAEPEDGYGWEKLFSERMCRHFREDFGLETRVARYHNVYGPHGTYDGGREKAPAAVCRKVAMAKLSGVHEIEIWGDGEQTRSFMYVDDCVIGSQRLLH